MNTQYKIVSGTLSGVEELVNGFLRSGWELAGQLCVTELKVLNSTNSPEKNDLIYSQPLTKNK